MEVFRHFKREREVTGDSPLGGTGCRHGLKMSSFVIGNALQCLQIRSSRLPAHSPSCWAQVTRIVSLCTGITVTFNWILTSKHSWGLSNNQLDVIKSLPDLLKFLSNARIPVYHKYFFLAFPPIPKIVGIFGSLIVNATPPLPND